MKNVIIENPIVDGVEKIPGTGILAMQVVADAFKGKKYVLSVRNHSNARISMVNPTNQNRWNSWETVEEMVQELEKDPRVQLYCFTSTNTFAQWLMV